MQSKNVRLIVVAAALSLAATAQAATGFQNGGFETGDFTGWTVEHGTTGNNNWTPGLGPANDIHQSVVSGNNIDPYVNAFDTPFNGTYMARLNRPNEATYEKSRIRQTAVMGAGDNDLYVNWGAVLQDPNHSPADQPYFQIDVIDQTNPNNPISLYSFQHTAGANNNAGWTETSLNSDIWYKSGQFSQIGGLAGKTIEIILTVADCDQGGHWGYAYLDGIGSVPPPPPPGVGVPDSGFTIAMLASALAGLIALRRRF